MPEIKFRVQDSQGVWQYGHIGNYVSIPRDMVPSTLGKYTGVEDKSGTEIYEGDIVYCCDMYGSQAIGTICYSNDFARFYIDLRNGSWLDLQQDDPPEVIGNTHTRIATPRGSFALLNIDLRQAEEIGLGYTFSHGDYHVVSYSDRAFAVRRDSEEEEM